jgi:hypothetical protein
MRAAQLIRGRTARRLLLVIAALAALAFLLVIAENWGEVRWGTAGTYDFVAYWSAAQLLRQGGNPYDPAALLRLQQQVGWPYDDPNRFWNPPWTLILMLPVTLLPFGSATVLWMVLQSLTVVISSLLLWCYFAPADGHPWFGLLLATGFFPSFSALNMGQISFWLLPAVVGFLWAERGAWDLAAGAALALLMIKPHLTYLFWAAALWWAWRSGRWRVPIGWIGGLIGASGFVLLLAPNVFHNYAAVLGALPPGWANPPSIGEWLTILLGVERTWFHFLPSLLGGFGLAGWLWHRRGPWRWEVLVGPLLLASVVTAAYGWSYDQVVLLPAVVALVAGLWVKRPLERVTVLLALVGAQLGLAAMSYGGVPDAFALWHAPLLGGVYWWGATRDTMDRRAT